MDNLKIRCSSLGKIVKSARGGKGLSQTAKSYLIEITKEHLYGIRKDISSKYLSKGIEVEDESIDLIRKYINNPFLIKNEDHFQNEFITGTPDIIIPKKVIDVKSSWDCFTFPLFDTKIPNMDYYWQLQGYMWLTERDEASLIYALVDTPVEYQYNEVDSFEYANVPIERRVKVFDIKRNESDIELIKSKVKECRLYVSELLKA